MIHRFIYLLLNAILVSVLLFAMQLNQSESSQLVATGSANARAVSSELNAVSMPATPTPVPNTPTVAMTATVTMTATQIITTTPTMVNTPVTTGTTVITGTPTLTATAVIANTPTETPTPVDTPTETPTDTPTNTPTSTFTPTPTFTPMPTFTPTFTPTPTSWPTTNPQAIPRNIIVMIGDGMGYTQVDAASIYKYGETGSIAFEYAPYTASMTTYAKDSAITDSAAAASAMATGQKLNNGVIAMAIPGNSAELETTLEHYRNRCKLTGLVTTSNINHATPASFGAHEPARYNYSQIAGDFFGQTRPNLLFGGKESGITTAAAQAAGYQVVTNRASMQSLSTPANPFNNLFISGQFGNGHFDYEYDQAVGQTNFYSSNPHLSEMANTALDLLDDSPEGFFLMIEGARIDHAGHSNLRNHNIFETLEFENTFQQVINWMAGRDDTLLIVTADHETGGLSIRQNNGRNNFPTVSWSTGGHTSKNVAVYAWGPNAQMVNGTIDNTDIYGISIAGSSPNAPCAPPTPTPTPTPTATPTNTATPTKTPTPTHTATPRPTNTSTPTRVVLTPTSTSTSSPAATSDVGSTAVSPATPTARSTPRPNVTSTARPTNTSLPTIAPVSTMLAGTPTSAPTAIQTMLPTPTATNTRSSSTASTPMPTIFQTPTAIVTNTSVPIATNTSVPIATNTPVPVPTNTSVPILTATPDPLEQFTATPAPTNTPVPVSTNTSVPASTNTPVPASTNTPQPLATAKPAQVQVDAQFVDKEARVSWNFTADADTIWFHIYRARKPDFSEAVQVSEQFIPSQHSGSHIYHYEDTSQPQDGIYFYWVEQVLKDFESKRHGPASLAIHGTSRTDSSGTETIYLPLIETNQ